MANTLTGPCVVNLVANTTVGCTVAPRSEPGATIQEYMGLAADNFESVELPLGGRITKVDNTHVELVVPRISLFDVWLQPSAIAALEVSDGRLQFTSLTDDIKLEGSSHVKDFKLDERFNLEVNINITWDNSGTSGTSDKNTSGTDSDADASVVSEIGATGSLSIQVDIPPPFSFMPKSLLESTGNAAMSATNSIILNAFVSGLAKDYALWSSSSAVREKRAEAKKKQG